MYDRNPFRGRFIDNVCHISAVMMMKLVANNNSMLKKRGIKTVLFFSTFKKNFNITTRNLNKRKIKYSVSHYHINTFTRTPSGFLLSLWNCDLFSGFVKCTLGWDYFCNVQLSKWTFNKYFTNRMIDNIATRINSGAMNNAQHTQRVNERKHWNESTQDKFQYFNNLCRKTAH